MITERQSEVKDFLTSTLEVPVRSSPSVRTPMLAPNTPRDIPSYAPLTRV